jgi:hypothetical protein
MSYSHEPGQGRFADLVWFDDPDEAQKSASFSGSGLRRMDGSEVLRTPIITGLDKLSRIQQRPLPYFYAALMRDVMEADVLLCDRSRARRSASGFASRGGAIAIASGAAAVHRLLGQRLPLGRTCAERRWKCSKAWRFM